KGSKDREEFVVCSLWFVVLKVRETSLTIVFLFTFSILHFPFLQMSISSPSLFNIPCLARHSFSEGGFLVRYSYGSVK
ncbi:MAG TPA: hypothetical protein VNS32_25500, partial [Flavisolibacter sp.]|nr:hypothetical protein [Flavisolibacter sp.]